MKKQQLPQKELQRLINKVLQGSADNNEISQLEEWFQDQEETAPIVESDLDKKAYRDLLFEKTLQKIEARKLDKNQKSYSIFWKVAASFIAFGLLSFLVYFIISQSGSEPSYQSFLGQAGERTEINLQDGSKIILNGEGKLLVSNDFDRERKVKLEGEAFFQVSKDLSRPFEIQSPQLTTTVLGTSFIINASLGSQEKVSVKSGKVQVRSNSNSSEVILTKGEQTNWSGGRLSLTSIQDQDQEFGWLQGKLVFRNETLPEISKKLENWYGIKVSIEGSKDTDCKITGTYSNLSIQELMELIQFTTNINFTIHEKNLIIKSTGC